MLEKIIKFSITNKLIIGMLTLMLVIWGIWSASKLPIDAVPDITNNQVQIITICPTLAGQEVEQLVTFPIEQSIANVPDLEEIRSISRFGLSVITAVFAENVDVYFARQLINERLQEATDQIPDGIGKPELAPVSTGLGEVYQYILHPKKGSEGKYTATDLRTMQDWIVARQLRGTPGVAEINSFGGLLKQYEVAVNPDRLKAMGVSIPEIFAALESNNQNTGGAYIDKKPNAYFIRGIGLVGSLADIGSIVVKRPANSVPVFVKDVADVRLGNAIRYGALTYNGEVDAVGGVVMMLKGENSNEVVNRIKQKIPTIQQSLPEDVVIEPYLDRTELVGRAISTVEKNLVEGALIVIFVLVLFLGNLRAGLIVASAIPLAMLFALGMMRLFGVSANLMSLGAIDFGLIVDGSVIVVEATLHHLGLRKSVHKLTQREMDQEVYESASKIRATAAFGEIIILIVYIPILTLVGIEGKMFRPMAMTVGFAILGALVLSLTYIPMMCALLLPKTWNKKATFSDRMMAYLHRIYEPLLAKAIRIKYVLIGGTVAVFALSVFVFSRMGSEFIPNLDEGDFAFHCILPQGTSLSQSMETSMQASRILKGFDEVKMVVGKTGAAEVPTDPMPPEATDMMIILKSRNQWPAAKSYQELAGEMMEALEVIPGVFFEANQPIQMRFNELMTGIRQDVAVKIFGENLDTLRVYADRVSAIIGQVPGTTTPQVERIAGLPQINVVYDRTRIANYGLNVSDLNDILSTGFAGKRAGMVFENERRFDLVVRLDSIHRTSIDDVRNLWVPLPDGRQVPLSQLADISVKIGPAQISREEGKRRIVIGFNLDGRDVGSVVSEIQDRLNQQVKLPPGYYYTYGGMFENLQEASQRLLVAVPASLLLIFILLYFTFHSFSQAILIFTAIPMSAIGGVFALLIRDMPFSISAGIGFIALFGVAVLNGIVLIGTFNQLRKEGMTDAVRRIVEGTRIRLRPVLMTATVASLGFLPMALSTSAGAEVQRPLATVVIGGLVTATFLTLFVLPLLYVLFSTRSFRKKAGGRVGIWLFAWLIPLGVWPETAAAENSQDTVLTEAMAVKLAIENNSRMRASELRVDAATVQKGSVLELPKTQVTGQFGHFNSPEKDNALEISQSIPFPTVFGARAKNYEAARKGAEIQRDISIAELQKEVRSAYHEVRYLQQRQQRLLRLDTLFARFVAAAKLRYQAGDSGQIAVSMAETKRSEVRLLVLENDIRLRNSRKELFTLINDGQPWTVPDDIPFLPIPLTQMPDPSIGVAHPLIRQYQQQAEIALGNKRLELANALPDFSVGYGNQSLVGTYDRAGQPERYGRDKRFSYLTVGVDIPLTFGASRARLRQLDYEAEAAKAEANNQTQQMKTRIEQELANYGLATERYQYLDQEALPNAAKLLQGAELGYRIGELSYIEYLNALQVVTDTELAHLQAIDAINQTVITLQYYLNQN
ncbi:CusA/CzcA family heavy metal efflux RND transporter [Parapedobacter sp. GCM10030251]|uniref:CusA/CzcA family heavy metal efflux RND transporter n=1 Tax=Parapedobacter sp. GCM10030251 TaxID=3273419 RepID=UPI00360DDEDB